MQATLSGRLAAVLTLCLSIALLTGCTLLEDRDARLRLVTQYSVLKLIDRSSSITAEDVIAGVGRARDVVSRDGEVTIGDLALQVRTVINWDRLDAADRLLLDAILLEAEAELRRRIGDGLLSEDHRVAVLTLLDWIELAALMG